MLRGYPGVHRWEQTDDVFQSAMLRLHRALAQVNPESLRHFYNLATLAIRRELLDQAKHHYGPAGQGAFHHSDAEGRLIERQPDSGLEPASLQEWTEFHEKVAGLPEEERELVGLLFYQGLTQEQAAVVLGVTTRTVKRRWRNARVRLAEALKGEYPEA
jgi:RNA polymerase sigma-70 factor (ECF subfamily)